MARDFSLSEALPLTGTAQSTAVFKVISTGSATATLNCKLYGSATAVNIPLAPGVVFEADMREAKITTGTGISVIAFR